MDSSITNERDVTVSEMADQMARPIQAALQEVENTFLAVRELWPRPGWAEEYTQAFTRLREICEYLDLEIVRQDLTFSVERNLHKLREHCLWLVRRIGREVFFRVELAMERELRAQTAGSAYDVYLRLIEVQDLEAEFHRLNDAQMAKSLVSGKLETYRDLGTPLVPQ